MRVAGNGRMLYDGAAARALIEELPAMLSVESRNVHDEVSADCLRSLYRDIRSLLERKRNALAGEIRSYPPPIPACDAHFNFMLEERAKVSHELTRIDEACGTNSPSANSAVWLRGFIRNCAYIDDTIKHTLLARLHEDP